MCEDQNHLISHPATLPMKWEPRREGPPGPSLATKLGLGLLELGVIMHQFDASTVPKGQELRMSVP